MKSITNHSLNQYPDISPKQTPMNKEWGYHLILDCANVNLQKINTQKSLERFIHILMRETGMKPLGKPVFQRNAPTRENILYKNDGISVVQIITTSSIVIHCVESERALFFDLFSCKPFNANHVVSITQQYFETNRCRARFIERPFL